jgi:MFS family permease
VPSKESATAQSQLTATLTSQSQITSFYGQTQFQNRFGVFDPATGKNVITAAWQSGLSNSALVGQLTGLLVNAYAQDRFGCRPTMMAFMAWMAVMIFIPVFAPSLPILAWGESMCGVSWGVFQVCLSFCTVRVSANIPTSRPSPRPTPPKSSPLSSAPISPPTSACAGAPGSSSPPASSALSPASTEISGGGSPSSCNGSGQSLFSSAHISLPNHHGMPSVADRLKPQGRVSCGCIRIRRIRNAMWRRPSHILDILRHWK